MHFPLLQDIVVLLGFSVVVVLLLQRLRLPSVLGFLVTGIIIGPFGFGLIENPEQIEILSEIGVILLMFVIGMELSIKQLASMKRTVFLGGLLQVGLSIIVTAFIFSVLGFSWNEAVFMGFLFSLSSTAIVLKILYDRNEITAPHGRMALGILIFQDLIVVPMMLITPMMAGTTGDLYNEVLLLVLKSALVLALTYVGAKYLVPRAMYLIAQTKSKELFLLATIALCFTVAFITASAGLSLAFGAFLAGLIISESDYSHQATSTILPFRELFISFFFISIGMLLDLDFFMKNAAVIMLMVVVVFILKGGVVSLTAAALKYPIRTVLLTGMALFQVGEFAFILSRIGIESGLLSEEMNQYFLSVSVFTMLLTPFVFLFSGRATNFILRKIAPGSHRTVPLSRQDAQEPEDHLLIIGYGINGANLAKAAKYADIPYMILELNPQIVRQQKARGEPIIYGDAVQEHMLEAVHVNKARIVVIAISDPRATKAIVSNIRHISPSVHIVVRTRYVKEIETLLGLGADEVIPEEFETSIEIFSRVLTNFLVPLDELENLIDSVRADNYQVFQSHKRLQTFKSSTIPDFKISCVRVMADSGAVVGKTIEEVDVRKNYGVNILAVSRKGQMIKTVFPNVKLLREDLVFVSGDQEHIDSFYKAVT
ncbi:monovalent cation:proton antiporter-2 (CPA2) family protein [Salinimicrobium sp. MT39]|uniref:Monovalent cation:proton antiporter-2 (CPA2) family protein n=1 Tax=Salinimicrobium profundisediminis TaxID=2994553 RepID=A0A9X3CV39_9FLAO|nr:monovalent cation:proton antiporter family protein [Salinimicrobium profundisediminis]MCX2837387.1 monovalent cation:proton antiporter-2 (CPA2) family protein [Salinimicrobium profundisediminis]